MKIKIQLIKMCWDAEKVVLGGIFIASNTYIRKEERFKNQSHKFPIQETRKKKKSKLNPK